MSSLSSRLSLQESRFTMIQKAAELAWEEPSSPLTNQLINTRLELLDANWEKFQAEHEEFYREDFHSIRNEPYFKTKTFERCQEFYAHARAALLVQQRRSESSGSERNFRSPRATSPVSRNQNHRTSLPRISLPKFSGDYQSWRSFHDLFSSMIANNAELNSVEKMHYLKSCLSGEAFQLISNMPVSSDTFAAAWEVLLARYENKRLLITAQLDKILNLKPIKERSATELRSFLTTVTECIGALRALECHTQYWDPLLLHLLVRLLDPKSREAWELRLGSSISYPKYSQFEEFLTCRTRAMESLANPSSSSKDHRSRFSPRSERGSKSYVATSADSSKQYTCSLCDASHFTAGCSKFRPCSPLERKNLIEKHQLCYNCLGRHKVNHCPSTRRCLKCGRKHHTSIHWESPTKPATFKKPNSQSSSATEGSVASSTASSSANPPNR